MLAFWGEWRIMLLAVGAWRSPVAQAMKEYGHLREKAIRLRREQQLSLGEIVERLNLPKTTVYEWIRHIQIPRTQKQSDGQRRGTLAMQEKSSRRREEAYRVAYAEAKELLCDLTFRDFVVLYMAEGYRRNRNVVSLSNSSVRLIKLANRWIRQLTTNKISYCLQYHVDQDPEELIDFWATELGADKESISAIRKSNSGQLSGRQWRSTYGVMCIRVGDTYFRAKMQAWMDYIQAQW